MGLTSASLRYSDAISSNDKFVCAFRATLCVYFAAKSSGLWLQSDSPRQNPGIWFCSNECDIGWVPIDYSGNSPALDVHHVKRTSDGIPPPFRNFRPRHFRLSRIIYQKNQGTFLCIIGFQPSSVEFLRKYAKLRERDHWRRFFRTCSHVCPPAVNSVVENTNTKRYATSCRIKIRHTPYVQTLTKMSLATWRTRS